MADGKGRFVTVMMLVVILLAGVVGTIACLISEEATWNPRTWPRDSKRTRCSNVKHSFGMALHHYANSPSQFPTIIESPPTTQPQSPNGE